MAMSEERKKEVADDLAHAVAMYGYTDSRKDREYLGKILFYSGLLAGEYL